MVKWTVVPQITYLHEHVTYVDLKRFVHSDVDIIAVGFGIISVHCICYLVTNHSFFVFQTNKWAYLIPSPLAVQWSLLWSFSECISTVLITVLADHSGRAVKAWTVFDRYNTGIASSNPIQGMAVCVYSVFVIGSGLATCWSPVQGVLMTV
jgi:hypothetical protein